MKRNRASRETRLGSSVISHPQAKPNRRRWIRWAWLVAGLGLALAFGGWLRWGSEWWSVGQDAAALSEPPIPLGEPPVDASVVLRLPAPLPRTAEEFGEEALAVGQRLVESLPDESEAHAQLAMAYLQVGQDRAALASWRAAVARDERFSQGHLGIGTILADQGETDQAIAALRKAIELDPELEQAYRQLTELLLRQGDSENAVAVARECVRRFPAACENHFWLGQSFVERGDWTEARRSHEEAVRINPNWTHSYYPLSLVCARLGEHAAAAGYRQQFAALKSADLRDARNPNQDYDDVATQRQAILRRHVLGGSLQLRHGNPLAAEAHWVRAAAIVPADVPTRKALTALYQQQDRAGAELRFLEELIRLEPDQPAHPLRKGRLLVALRSWSDAEQTLLQVLDLQPASVDAHLLLAEMDLRRGGDLAAAQARAEQAVGLEASPRSLLLLAAICGARGDRPAALAALRHVLTIAPENAEARQAYEQLLATN